MTRAAVIATLLLVGCDDFSGDKARAAERAAMWNGPCSDEIQIRPLTAPGRVACWNSRHQLTVSTATLDGVPTGAVVACRCRPETDGGR